MTTQSSHASPILVTGAAGAVGSIGRHVTEMLLAKGHNVRALVRREDERAEALRQLGAVARHHGVDVFVNMSQMTVTQMSITESSGWRNRLCPGRVSRSSLENPTPHIGQIYNLTGFESAAPLSSVMNARHGVAARGTRAAGGEPADHRALGLGHASGREPTGRRLCAAAARTRLG